MCKVILSGSWIFAFWSLLEYSYLKSTVGYILLYIRIRNRIFSLLFKSVIRPYVGL